MASAFTGLDDYKLAGVKVTDTVLGRGAYATVLELEYMGLKCAGKKIHELLLVQGNSSYAIQHFQEECRLLSRLHHPNIVQFLGVYFHNSKHAPILVMEYLPTNLTTLIEDYGILPEEMGYPILHGVALGLCFLHNQSPPIIHRDLSSNNVLLNANLTAKISDLGVARILNLNSVQASRMTQIPGTPAYMPPEAIVPNPDYNASVDVFSFGVMIIHVFCGQWPEPQGGPIRYEGETMIPVSEAERREEYLQVIGEDHMLMPLMKKCVSNIPQLRPHTNDIVKKLSDLVQQFSSDVSNQLDRFVRSRTDSVQGPERKADTEGGVSGCIRRRPVYKVKAPTIPGQGSPKSASFPRNQTLKLAKVEEETVSADGARGETTTARDPLVMRKISLELEHAISSKIASLGIEGGRKSPSPGHKDIQETNLESSVSYAPSPICIANYNYTAKHTTELTFKKGDMFTVTYSKENWWLARSMDTGKEGLIPSNYVSTPLKDGETDPSQIQLIRKIATGQFSSVWEGQINGKLPSVAVKVLKPGKVSSANKFLKKATIMKVLSHPKVVHVLAVCTKEMPVYIICELMKHGNLLHFLRNDGRVLGQRDLMKMATQVSEGMTYLEEKGYIHRDLAARSVLVGENQICKLANFHLAQFVDGKFYKAPSNDKVAIKWTAPDAAKSSTFTIKSDVWSFGVLLFEFITHGRFPYPGMTNSQVMNELQHGFRMPKPMECPHQLYSVMLDCWKEEARSRPSFQMLYLQLNAMFS